MSNNNLLKWELDEANKKIRFWKIATIMLLLLACIYRGAVYWTSNKTGLYTVYACKEDDNCYVLKADVYQCGGGACVDRLYFDNGGSVHMKCAVGDKTGCTDWSDSPSNGDEWKIKLIERDGDRRNKEIENSDYGESE